MTLVIATDGSSGKDGTGAWAWTEGEGRAEGTGFATGTTNQRMELTAVVEALEFFPDRIGIEIVSDSAYVVNCMNDGWYNKWDGNGWVTSSGKPVANQDLWDRLLAVYRWRRGCTIFTHVRGHQGHPLNERADMLATTARREGKARL